MGAVMFSFREIDGNSGVVKSHKPKAEGKNEQQLFESNASTDDQFADFFKREIEKKEAIIRQIYSNNPEKLKETLDALHKRYKI